MNKNMGILELFEQASQKFKRQVAIESHDQQLTYEQLNQATNQLANCLIANQLQPGALIAVMLEERIHIIIALIGILKAGCVFVPLDPEFPKQRLRQMVTALTPDGLITTAKFNQRLAQMVSQNQKISRLLYLEEPAQSKPINHSLIPTVALIAAFSTEKPNRSVDNEAMCYIYHTSGSTGTPKGIMGRLKSISHFVTWEIETFQISAGWRVSQFTMPTFDAFLRDVFVPLSVGGTLCIPPERNQLLDPPTLIHWLDNQRINLVHCVPSLFKVMVEGPLDAQRLKSLKYLLLAGEVLHVSDIEKWMGIYDSRIQLVNLYGPSETSMVKFFHLIQAADIKRGFIPIGRPITGTKAIILDDDKEVCPPGIIGELYIRTPYLTLGYYNQPKLTQQVFLPNPLSQNSQDIIYKTGDLARILSDGHFQFLGRKDTQIKIRGIRIELEEIENAILNHEKIKNAVVQLWQDSSSKQRLVAYFVAACEPVPTTNELQDFLKQTLPSYMIPSIFMPLDVIPLTPHGKVNRLALPKPTETRLQSEKGFQAPRNTLERQLSRIWEALLNVKPIGRHDNFFDWGGHSLSAITLRLEIEKAFDKHLALIEMFHNPTIAQQADLLTRSGVFKGSSLETIQSQGTLLPFFFIGSTNYARALVPTLGDNQPIYGLNIFGLLPTEGAIPSLNVTQIAKQYCQEIQYIQPKGPYYLGGYCGDAKVAFEIAQQFQASGQKIAFLAFIDVIWQPHNRYFGFYRHWHNFLENGPGYLFYKLGRRMNYLKLQLQLSWSQQIENFHHQLGRQSPYQLREMQFINHYYQALNNYEPQPYAGKITLFLSSDWRLKHSATLAQLAKKGLEIHEISGYHENLFEKPQIEELGEQIRHCLLMVNY